MTSLHINRGLLLILSLLLITYYQAKAIDHANPATHCEKDISRINEILNELKNVEGNIGERRIKAAELLIGCEYDTDETNDSTGVVKLNVHTFTPLSFINAVHALSSASMLPSPNWTDYAKEYEKITCRRGEDTGFASVLHSGSDWIADNLYRGNIKELTENYDGAIAKTKSIDYMSRHREKYAALANPETFDKIEMIDMGYKQHRVPYLKRQYITRNDIVSDIQDGDIIMLLSNDDGVDICGVYYVNKDGTDIYLTGMDPVSKKIVKYNEPAERMFKLLVKRFFGFRWLRFI